MELIWIVDLPRIKNSDETKEPKSKISRDQFLIKPQIQNNEATIISAGFFMANLHTFSESTELKGIDGCAILSLSSLEISHLSSILKTHLN